MGHPTGEEPRTHKGGVLRRENMRAHAHVYAAAAASVSEPAETAPRVTQSAPVPVKRECRDEFLIGRYDRHETDPNVHVWEPWRR